MHYNTSFPGYRDDSLDVSYSIAPHHNNIDPDNHEFVLLVCIFSALFLLIAIIIVVKKCRTKKSGGASLIDTDLPQQVQHRGHLQTMTTGRGTEIESNTYSSVLEDRDTILSKGSLKK